MYQLLGNGDVTKKFSILSCHIYCAISIRVLRLLLILTDLNELRINVGYVSALEHCVTTGILAATEYTFTTPD